MLIVRWADAGASASSDASASCDGCAENIGILAVVMAELELSEVQGQIFLADVVVCADDSALEQAPEVLKVVSMNLAAYILALAVTYGIVREAKGAQVVIALMLIGRDEIDFVTDCFAHEAIKGRSVRVLDDLANHVTLARDGADHRGLAAQTGYVLALVPMAVLVLPADASLINFDDSHKLLEFSVSHSRTQAMTDEPRGWIGRSNLALDLLCAYALLGVEHLPEYLEPRLERVIGILENSAYQHRESIGLALPRVRTARALPVEGARLGRIHLSVSATRAADASRPPTLHQEILTSGFIRKGAHQFA
jgi:hypothetical protein